MGEQPPAIDYLTGLPERFRAEAVALYDRAFGAKLALAVPDDAARRRLLHNGLLLDYAIGAVANDRLLGIAGLHTPDGSLTGGITYAGLLARLGIVRGHWAALVFSCYERKPAPGELLMDGIAVCVEARGHGIGGRLLDEVAGYAASHGFKRVRLDVIDTNPNARRLYARKGFAAVKTERFPWLRWLLKFGGSTTMVLAVGAERPGG